MSTTNKDITNEVFVSICVNCTKIVLIYYLKMTILLFRVHGCYLCKMMNYLTIYQLYVS